MSELAWSTAPWFVGGAVMLASALTCAQGQRAPLSPPHPRVAEMSLSGFESQARGTRLRVRQITVERKPILGIFGIAGLNEETVDGVQLDAAPEVGLLAAFKSLPLAVPRLEDLHLRDVHARFYSHGAPCSLVAAAAALGKDRVELRDVLVTQAGRSSRSTRVVWYETQRALVVQ